MSTIAAGTTSGTALVSTGNTSGELQLQVNGTTPSVTLAANGSIGVGSSPSYGTNGQLLTSSGTGSAPTWTTPSTGALVLLSTVTASASATVDIETTFSSTYDVYLIEASGISVASDGVPLVCQMKIGGSYITTTTYLYHSASNGSNSGTYSAYNSGASSNIYFIDNIGNAANRMANFYMHVSNPSSTTKSKMVAWQGGCISAAGVLFSIVGSGINTGTAALTGIRFSTNGNGNITAGSFRLYGIANS